MTHEKLSGIIPCCNECWHSLEKPCPDFVLCMTMGPICHSTPECKQLRQTFLDTINRTTASRPAIYVGAGTCGLGAGADKTLAAIQDYLCETNRTADIIEVGCIGLCTAEPIVDIEFPGRTRISFQNMTENKVKPLLDQVFSGIIPEESILGQFETTNRETYLTIPLLKDHVFFKPQTRWVLAGCGILDPSNIFEAIARGAYQAFTTVLKKHLPNECCSIIEASGLKGRGGGGFPTAKKWKIALDQNADQKYFICNADEGDPGAFMDRAVIEGDPHRVLEGIAIAAYTIGATKAYVYLRAEYPLAIKRLKQAIVDASELGLIGDNILDSGFHLNVIIKQGAGAFVCGEETALIHSIEGKRGMPRPRPPYPAVSGLFGKPTIINNVETIANIPTIFQHGADWFNSVGTASSKGTKVFALSGKVVRTGLVEIAMGTTIRDIVMIMGGGIPNGKQFKAVQIGGPSGGCLTNAHLDIQVDYESLKTVGAMMGSGGLVVMDEDNCMVDVAKFFMEFIQRESCGKCIPCREGTRRMLEILQSLTRARRNESGNDALERFKGIANLESLATVIRDTSLCGLGQSSANPILTTLRWFRDEYEAHVYERRCPAKACLELITYHIDEAKCTGCTLCTRKCPSGAIKGSVKSPHYIIEEKCIACGACYQACRFKAIEIV